MINNDIELYDLSINLDLDVNDAVEYFKNSDSLFYGAFREFMKRFNNVEKAINKLAQYIADNYVMCDYCNDIEHIDTIHYQEGSSDAYYSFIFDYDLEIETNINLDDDVAEYVYEHINSTFDDAYYCQNCITDLENEVINLIYEYKQNNESYINHYHSSSFKNKAKTILTLGFEIEHEYTRLPTFESIKKFLSHYGGFLHAENDTSLDSPSIEWISDILDFKFLFENKEFIQEFYNTIEELLNCSSNCGGHLHTNLKFCGESFKEQNKTLKILFDFVNDNYLFIKSISGRNNNSFNYCKIPFEYQTINDFVTTSKYSALNVHDNGTLEFRFWNTYKSFDSMLKRAVISYYMVFLAKNDNLTIENLHTTISLYNLTSEVNFKWYLDKMEQFI